MCACAPVCVYSNPQCGIFGDVYLRNRYVPDLWTHKSALFASTSIPLPPLPLLPSLPSPPFPPLLSLPSPPFPSPSLHLETPSLLDGQKYAGVCTLVVLHYHIYNTSDRKLARAVWDLHKTVSSSSEYASHCSTVYALLGVMLCSVELRCMQMLILF